MIGASGFMQAPKQAQQSSKLIGSATVMERMQVSYSTLKRLVNLNKIPLPFKVGSINKWLESDIDNFIENRAS